MEGKCCKIIGEWQASQRKKSVSRCALHFAALTAAPLLPFAVGLGRLGVLSQILAALLWLLHPISLPLCDILVFPWHCSLGTVLTHARLRQGRCSGYVFAVAAKAGFPNSPLASSRYQGGVACTVGYSGSRHVSPWEFKKGLCQGRGLDLSVYCWAKLPWKVII